MTAKEKLQGAWKKVKNGEETVEAVIELYQLSGGEQAVLFAAEYEWGLYKSAIQMIAEKQAGGALRGSSQLEAGLRTEFSAHYDKWDKDCKWALLPLFYDKELKSRHSHILPDEENEAYFSIFVESLETDGLDLEDVKAQFLKSGYNELLGSLLTCDPELGKK